MIFSYYGSKSKLWAKYPAPKFETIIEPFAGAANYALRHSEGHRVIIVEKSPIVAAMWRWLIKVPESVIRSLPIPEPKSPIPDVPDCPEARAFLGFALNRGSHTPKNFVGTYRPLNWDSICADLPRIRMWDVIEGDYTCAPDVEATWFIDPPYCGQNLYPFGRDLCYADLATWCQSRKGQSIVCENDTADWLPFKPLCTAPGQRQHSKLHNEGIWTNE